MILAALGKRKLQMEGIASKKSRKVLQKGKKRAAEKEKFPPINLANALAAADAVNSLKSLDNGDAEKINDSCISGDKSEDKDAFDVDDYDKNE